MRNRGFWAAIILTSGLVDIPGRLHVGPISAGGLLTVVVTLGIAALVLRRGAQARREFLRLWPLSALFLYSVLQCLWHSPSLQSYQNICALWIFLAPVVCFSMAKDDPMDPRYLVRLQLLATALTAVTYAFQILIDGLGSDVIGSDVFIGARTFALYILVGQALLLGRWVYGSRGSFWLAVAITLLIAFSLSRTVLAVSVLLFPVASLRSFSFRGLIRMAAIGGVAASALLYLVILNPALNERFLGSRSVEDFFMGDASVNTSGRLEFWAITLDSFEESPWLGKGPGTANDLISQTFGSDVSDHPHNEYLRILHDHGIFGLTLFLVGVFQLLIMCWKDYRRRVTVGSPLASLSLGTLLAFLGVLLTMITCNTASYVFVMAPLAVLVGSNLAYRESTAGIEPVLVSELVPSQA
jgi:O-antigen ligase